MTFNIMTRLGAVLATGAAALSMSAAPAVIAPTTAGALPISVKGCTPGQIKTVGGKKYVCDKHGHWIHVLNLIGGGSVPVAGVQTGGVIAATGGVRTLEKTNGGGSVTCGFGSKPGDSMEQRNYIYRNGQRVGFTSVTYLCGEDGQWHQVAQLGSDPQLTVVGGTVSAAVQGTRP
jgi:hypothetical protein